MDDHPPLTLGEVPEELTFAREWRTERADADELAGHDHSRSEEHKHES